MNTSTNLLLAKASFHFVNIKYFLWFVVTFASANLLHSQTNFDHLEPYRPQTLEEYNLKFGDFKVDFETEVGAAFNDNVNFADQGAIDDFSYTAGGNIRAFYQPSRTTAFNIDVFLGYQGFVEYDELSTLLIRPGSEFRIERRLNQFKIGFYNQAGVELDPIRRAYISGDAVTLAGANALEWRRITNTTGVGLIYQPARELHFKTGYEFQIDRSLSDFFKSLDNNRHVFQIGGYYDLNQQLTTGLEGEYAFRDYSNSNLPNSQNDNDSYTVGPALVITPSTRTVINLKVGYTSIDYSTSGGIVDLENFEGVTFSASLRNRLTDSTDHGITAIRMVDDGFGTNFAEQTSIGYNITSRFSRGLTGNLNALYTWLDTSGGAFAEEAELLVFGAGISKELSKKASLGLNYAFHNKISELVGRDFRQNVVTIIFSYDF